MSSAEQVMEMVQVKASLYGHLQPSGTESILLQHLVPAWNATPLSGMEPVKKRAGLPSRWPSDCIPLSHPDGHPIAYR